MTVESDYDTVLSVTARRARLDAAIAELAAEPSSHHWSAGWGVCVVSPR